MIDVQQAAAMCNDTVSCPVGNHMAKLYEKRKSFATKWPLLKISMITRHRKTNVKPAYPRDKINNIRWV